jgi:ribose/xylose/arabinose/galactoside ABC-type transport system permease subunit
MAAIARAIHRAFPGLSPFEVDTLKQIAVFALAGLVVSLLMMTYGLDLSPGFF